jgi:hypothetical protein
MKHVKIFSAWEGYKKGRHEKEKGVLYRSGMQGYMYKRKYPTDKCRYVDRNTWGDRVVIQIPSTGTDPGQGYAVQKREAGDWLMGAE